MVAPEPDDAISPEQELPFAPSLPSYPSTNQSATPAHYTPMPVSSVQSDHEIIDEDVEMLTDRHMDDMDDNAGLADDGRHEGG